MSAIPISVLNKFYEKDSLRNTENGFEGVISQSSGADDADWCGAAEHGAQFPANGCPG